MKQVNYALERIGVLGPRWSRASCNPGGGGFGENHPYLALIGNR
jgi:hypothetical protein